MTQEQIKIIIYAMEFLKTTLTHDHCDILNLGKFGKVWGKINNAKICFETLAERGQLKLK